MKQTEEIKIIAEPNLDTHFCKISVLNRDVLPGKILNCGNKEEAAGSPILEGLFAIEGIEKVVISESTFHIQKSGQDPWPVVGKKIGAVIRTALSSEKALFAEKQNALIKSPYGLDTPADLSSPQAMKIQELLNVQINPAVASHGGRITLIDVKDNIVYVRLEGGCQGCGMANQTLKNGVETMIRNTFPEIEKVVDITDHRSGANPYYQHSHH